MMMNGMGTGTGSTIIAGYRLADWATGLVLLFLSILIVALVGGFLGAAIDCFWRVFRKDAQQQDKHSSVDGEK